MEPVKYRHNWEDSRSLWCMRVGCQMYALTLVLLIPCYCVGVVHARPPADPSGSFYFSLAFALFELTNMLLNWFLFLRNLRLKRSAETGEASELSWCPICKGWLWRRDHHCFFLGACVAFPNLLHFVAFCLHASLGCSYALAVLVNDMSATYRPLWSADCIYYFLPFAIVKWLSGEVGLGEVCVVSLMSSVLAVVLSTGAIFVFQLSLVYRWRTTRDFRRRAVDPDSPSLASMANFERAFGHHWLRSLLFPKISLSALYTRGQTLKVI